MTKCLRDLPDVLLDLVDRHTPGQESSAQPRQEPSGLGLGRFEGRHVRIVSHPWGVAASVGTVTRSWVLDSVGDEGFEQLAESLPGTELQSLLLEVMRRRARHRTPHEVLAQYRRDRFVRPSACDPREGVAIDGHLFAAAADFEGIELSPVTPLGSSSVVAPTDQHRVLSALRATEVVSDPTNVLALECAERLRTAPRSMVDLATSHRTIRAQAPPDKPGYAAHFRLFALASAGREGKDHAVAQAGLVRHITTMQRALDRLEQHGYRFGARRIDVLASDDRTGLADRVAAAVGGTRLPLEHPYYSGGVRFMLWVTTPAGEEVMLVDGGLFDWVATLTSNQRNVFVATGMGPQLVATLLRP